MPRPTPFQLKVEYCTYSRHCRAGALKFHRTATLTLDVTTRTRFKPLPRQVSETFLYAPFKFSTYVVFSILLLSAYGCGLQLPDKENAPINFVDIASNTDQIAARHYPHFVTISAVDSREEKCEWFSNYSTREPIFTPSGELLLVDRYHDVLMDLIGYHSEFVFYDTKTCKKVRSYSVAGEGNTYSLEFSNNGEYLVRGSADMHKYKAHVQKIESSTGKIIGEWNYEHSHSPSVALSGDGSILAIGLAQHKNKEDTEGGLEDHIGTGNWERHSHRIGHATKGVLDEHVGRVILVDFTSGEVVRDWVESEATGIASVDASSDGEILAVGFRDGMAKILRWRTETPATIVQHTETVDKIMISPDDNLVFLMSSRDASRLVAHRLDSGEQVHEFEIEGSIGDFDISKDSKTLVIGSTRNNIEIVDLGGES